MNKKKYIIDTNAYFKILCYISNKYKTSCISEETKNEIDEILSSECYISKVTAIEIISVLGKYSRGSSKSISACNCLISETGEICNNTKYSEARKGWKKKEIKAWKKLIQETYSNKSEIFNINIVEFDEVTVSFAMKIIENALIFNFGSMDAIIIATAERISTDKNEVIIVTSDKSMKAAIKYLNMQHSDALKNISFLK